MIDNSSLDSSVTTLSKNNLKYLNQEFDENVLDLGNQKEFYRCKYMSDFEKLKKELPCKKNYSPLTDKKN